jgi:FkbH-like protein
MKPENQNLMTDSSHLYYRAPIDLEMGEIEIKNILLLGSCLSHVLLMRLQTLLSTHEKKCEIDHLLINNIGPLPSKLPRPIKDYSFQIIQPPLRTVFPENLFLRLDYQNIKATKNAFKKSVELLELFFDYVLEYQRKYSLTTFVTNFLVPQQNPLGRLFPKYDLRNSAFYVEELNRHLSKLIDKKNHLYLTDINEIAGSLGRRYIQDDILHISNHGSIIDDFDFAFDLRRLEKPTRFSKQYPLNTSGFIDAIIHEIISHYKIICQHNPVKIVIFDLDHTLWRGVLAEDGIHLVGLEGWPLGLLEALLVLKKRGILLAIASKNEEKLIIQQWTEIFGDHLKLDDFVVRKINWKEKAENINEILSEVHLLPSSALFIDDNPVEREKVRLAFPEMRILGANHYILRKILLWAPELQVTQITNESRQRTENISKRILESKQGTNISRKKFIDSLKLKIESHRINCIDHPDFPRAFELLNKTNQFNTTGQRWKQTECRLFFEKKGFFDVFKVKDKFTNYGLVGIVVIDQYHLVQVVMSCRVVGLDLEKKMMIHTVNYANGHVLTANFTETKYNLLCHTFFSDVGFYKKRGLWEYGPDAAPIRLSQDATESV